MMSWKPILRRWLPILLVVAGGCRSGDATATTRAARPAPILATTESGLEVRTLRVTAPSGLGVALRGRVEPAAGAADLEAAARNGWRIGRIPEATLPALVAALGTTTLDREGWHGQAYDWRELAAYPLGPEPRAVGVGGRLHRLEHGTLRLMFRGWTLPMEDGLRVHVELLPVHDRRRPGRLEPVLRRQRAVTRLDDARLELLLEAGYAYVIVAEPPHVDWDEPPEQGVAPGPAVASLPTVGELLLKVPALPDQRTLVVLLPRIPPELLAERAPETRG